MRKWIKYTLKDYLVLNRNTYLRKNSLEGFRKELGLPHQNTKSFFEMSNSYLPSLIRKILKEKLGKNMKTLSIGCGNGENEIPLVNEGYNIVLSDFDKNRITGIKKLFPNINVLRIDVLNKDFKLDYKNIFKHFDVVFVPGLFYAFNDAESLVALRNIKLLTKKMVE